MHFFLPVATVSLLNCVTLRHAEATELQTWRLRNGRAAEGTDCRCDFFGGGRNGSHWHPLQTQVGA